MFENQNSQIYINASDSDMSQNFVVPDITSSDIDTQKHINNDNNCEEYNLDDTEHKYQNLSLHNTQINDNESNIDTNQNLNQIYAQEELKNEEYHIIEHKENEQELMYVFINF